ncbi:MAG: Y4bD/Y4pK family protein [Gemmatimonadaceae bacterium]|nr:Y4bD/Y4pK family protein [Gemmatimonadaceae bacterium]
MAPLASGEGQTFRVTHPFHPLCGRTFQLIDCRQTWGEDRVYFYDDSGQLARLPVHWTDVEPDDPTVAIGAGRAHFRYDDLCRLADLLTRLSTRAEAPASSCRSVK